METRGQGRHQNVLRLSEFQTLLDDVYDEGYDAAEKDAQGENEGEEPR